MPNVRQIGQGREYTRQPSIRAGMPLTTKKARTSCNHILLLKTYFAILKVSFSFQRCLAACSCCCYCLPVFFVCAVSCRKKPCNFCFCLCCGNVSLFVQLSEPFNECGVWNMPYCEEHRVCFYLASCACFHIS